MGHNPIEGDGSSWSVSEDWESVHGIVNDLFAIDIDSSLSQLLSQFADEPLLLETVQALLEINTGASDRDHKQAKHRASNYLVEDGRLWKVASGRAI